MPKAKSSFQVLWSIMHSVCVIVLPEMWGEGDGRGFSPAGSPLQVMISNFYVTFREKVCFCSKLVIKKIDYVQRKMGNISLYATATLVYESACLTTGHKVADSIPDTSTKCGLGLEWGPSHLVRTAG